MKGLLSLLTLHSVFSLQILERNSIVWTAEGNISRLSCAVDSIWQWCYWSHHGVKYSIASSQGSLNSSDVFLNSEPKECILTIPVTEARHNGTWKCHLANTDETESNFKVEAFLTLNVAIKASLEFHIRDQNGDESPMMALEGDSWNLSCLLTSKFHHPSVQVQLLYVSETKIRVLETKWNQNIEHSFIIPSSFVPFLSHFECRGLQSSETGRFRFSSSASKPQNFDFGIRPKFLPNQIEWTNETLLSVFYKGRPQPSYKWSLMPSPLKSESIQVTENNTRNQNHEYEISFHFTQMVVNHSLSLELYNSFGSDSKILFIGVVKVPKEESTENFENKTYSVLHSWKILLFLLLLLTLILCLILFTLFFYKRKRIQSENEGSGTKTPVDDENAPLTSEISCAPPSTVNFVSNSDSLEQLEKKGEDKTLMMVLDPSFISSLNLQMTVPEAQNNKTSKFMYSGPTSYPILLSGSSRDSQSMEYNLLQTPL